MDCETFIAIKVRQAIRDDDWTAKHNVPETIPIPLDKFSSWFTFSILEYPLQSKSVNRSDTLPSCDGDSPDFDSSRQAKGYIEFSLVSYYYSTSFCTQLSGFFNLNGFSNPAVDLRVLSLGLNEPQ